MKTHHFYTTALAVAILASTGGIASAQQPIVNVSANAAIEVSAKASTSDDRKATTTKERSNATSTKAREEYGSTTASTTAGARGELMSATHRSTVATFVHSLLNVANRDGGIGTQVREIAKTQNDSATTTAEAIAKVEARGRVATFLIGSDYKNLGVIRSELATTTNSIDRLTKLLDKTTSATVRAELTADIEALKQERAKVEAFVTARETSFSLFGWFTKLFSR